MMPDERQTRIPNLTKNILALFTSTSIIRDKSFKTMKNNTPRTWLIATIVTLVAASFVSVTNWLLASPSEAISQAVSSSGATSVEQADADQFLDAVVSVLVGVNEEQSAPYVAAAVAARPDLKDQIMEMADEVNSPSDDDSADRHRVSHHRRRCRICYRGHTRNLPCRQARRFLQTHPRAMRGRCPRQQWTPPPHWSPSPTPYWSPRPHS